MIKKDWNFCYQVLKTAAFLDEELKSIIYTFFNFNFLFNSKFLFYLVVAFQQY